MNDKPIRIATRQSPLAMWQANTIREQLLKIWPEISIELLPLVTSGDRFLNDRLLKVGGKGLFVKELEEALLDGRADLAVHSMKDVPVTFPEGLCLAVICERHDPLDALISIKNLPLAELPHAAVVGTSSLRRKSQLLNLRPDLNIEPLRGNIQTRLEKMNSGHFQAIILAAAGLERMGLEAFIAEKFTPENMLPAAGQGALGVECRVDDEIIKALLAPLNHPLTARCVSVEREVNALLGGNCHTPLAAYCHPSPDHTLTLCAKVASEDGQTVIQSSQHGNENEALILAHQAVDHLIKNGASALLS